MLPVAVLVHLHDERCDVSMQCGSCERVFGARWEPVVHTVPPFKKNLYVPIREGLEYGALSGDWHGGLVCLDTNVDIWDSTHVT